MNAFIFVSIICMNAQCDFFTSTVAMEKAKCEVMKKDFMALPFKKEITFSGAQCMPFNPGTQV